MRGASEAREHAAHLRNIRDHFRSGRFGQREVWERQLEAAALTLEAFTAPSAGAGERVLHFNYANCLQEAKARLVEARKHTTKLTPETDTLEYWCAWTAHRNAEAQISAAPSPSRREPTREAVTLLNEIIAIDQREKKTVIDFDGAGATYETEQVDGPCAERSRAVLALLDRAGNTGDDEICAACGAAKREHAPGGTRWGPTTLCGVFIPQDRAGKE